MVCRNTRYKPQLITLSLSVEEGSIIIRYVFISLSFVCPVSLTNDIYLRITVVSLKALSCDDH